MYDNDEEIVGTLDIERDEEEAELMKILLKFGWEKGKIFDSLTNVTTWNINEKTKELLQPITKAKAKRLHRKGLVCIRGLGQNGEEIKQALHDKYEIKKSPFNKNLFK